MDCMDCHNRPSHTYEVAGRAVNRALAAGDLDATLPYARKAVMDVIGQTYATTADSEREIPLRLTAYYEKNYPQVAATRRAVVERQGRAALSVYSRSIFPEMKVTWGAYPNNLGHTDFDGCFRCHDERASSPAGRTIPQDCETCHKTLAQDEAAPKILSELGLDKHR
jgi:hypothetical protein